MPATLRPSHLVIPKAMAARMGVQERHPHYDEIIGRGLVYLLRGLSKWDPAKSPTGEKGLDPYLCQYAKWGILAGLKEAKRHKREVQAPATADGSERYLEETIADHRTKEPPEALERAEARQDAAKLLAVLRPLDREMVCMYYLEGRTLGEISSAMALSKERVRQRLYRALAVMRKVAA